MFIVCTFAISDSYLMHWYVQVGIIYLYMSFNIGQPLLDTYLNAFRQVVNRRNGKNRGQSFVILFWLPVLV